MANIRETIVECITSLAEERVLAPGGRHSLRLPYYIHTMPGGSLLAGGAHMPTSADLQAIRQAIPGVIPSVLASPPSQTS